MSNSEDDFSKHPVSLKAISGEKRASKWTPRETLIELLRDIDSGKANPVNLIVMFTEDDETEATTTTHYRCASRDFYTTLGVIEVTKRHIMEGGEE